MFPQCETSEQIQSTFVHLSTPPKQTLTQAVTLLRFKYKKRNDTYQLTKLDRLKADLHLRLKLSKQKGVSLTPPSTSRMAKQVALELTLLAKMHRHLRKELCYWEKRSLNY